MLALGPAAGRCATTHRLRPLSMCSEWTLKLKAKSVSSYFADRLAVLWIRCVAQRPPPFAEALWQRGVYP